MADEERKEYYGAGLKVMYKGRCYRLLRTINGKNGIFCVLAFPTFTGQFTVNPEKEAVIPGPVSGRKIPKGEEWDKMTAMWFARNRGELSNLEFQKMAFPNYPLVGEFHPNFLPKSP